MQERFLAGQDFEFVDYHEIDNDESLEDLTLRQQDEEEAYFDAD